MTLRNCQLNPRGPVGTFVRLCHHAEAENGGQRRLARRPYCVRVCSGFRAEGHLI
jgi:hypothetical protein